MSKQSLLNAANFNFFKNTDPKKEMVKGKDADGALIRVMADYSHWNQETILNVIGKKEKATKGKLAGKTFIRLTFGTTDVNGQKEYHSGALFYVRPEDKKNPKQPDFTGSVNLDNDPAGPKLKLAAWMKKGEKSGDYLSVAISEFQEKNDAASAEPFFEEETTVAKSATPKPAAKQAKPAPQPEVQDFQDSEIPF